MNRTVVRNRLASLLLCATLHHPQSIWGHQDAKCVAEDVFNLLIWKNDVAMTWLNWGFNHYQPLLEQWTRNSEMPISFLGLRTLIPSQYSGHKLRLVALSSSVLWFCSAKSLRTLRSISGQKMLFSLTASFPVGQSSQDFMPDWVDIVKAEVSVCPKLGWPPHTLLHPCAHLPQTQTTNTCIPQTQINLFEYSVCF